MIALLTSYLQAPSPPHIHIPPTAEDGFLVLPPYSDFVNNVNREDNEIVKTITQGHHAVKPKEWKYESRRQAQSILPFIYLGPSSAARDINFLREQGITMLLVIRDTTTATSGLLSGQKAARELGIVSQSIDVQGNQELIRAFPRAINVINNHLVQAYRTLKDTIRQPSSLDTPPAWGKVLVWCESGNERSATVVAAYIMAMYNLDLVGAIQYIQTQRFCVAFDDGLKNLLFSYQQLLEARSCIPETKGHLKQTQIAVREKRSRDEVDDGIDTEMDASRADDFARFGGRNFAPFS
jgi:serine/threonine/tyrosine-interacting protein